MIIKSADAFYRKKSAVSTLEQLAVPEWAVYREYWELIDHVLAGELAVKSFADKYIYRPMSKRGNTTEAWMSWEAYKSRGKLPKSAAETLEKMQGTICAKPPHYTLESKANRLEFFREDATSQHDGLDALFARVVENVLKYGRYCLLLEPNEDGDLFHINEYRPEKLLRVVPVEDGGDSYAKVIYLDTSNIRFDIHSHRTYYCPQITVLALDGNEEYYQAKFGTGEVPVKGFDKDGVPIIESKQQQKNTIGEVFAALEQFDIDNPEPGTVIYPTKFNRTMNRIPFTVVNPTSLNFMKYATPPMLDLCVQSLHILNADCDHQQAIYLTTDPIPKFTRMEAKKGDKVMLSADRSLILSGEADFDFVSAPTSGLQMQAANIAQMHEIARQMGLNISGTDGAANASGVALEILRNAQTAKLRMVNQTCAKAIEEQLRRAGQWLLNMDIATAADNIKYTPSADLAKAKPTLQELSAFANVADKFSVTKKELREWLEENFDFEHKDWDDLQLELEAERELAEIGTGFNIPPVAPNATASDVIDKE